MANVPTVSWDETAPAGGTDASLGDDRIREFKTQLREVIDVDHDMPSSGQAADVGQHKQVTLQEQADLGTGAEGVPILGAQTASGKAELFFTDEDDNDIQITNGGALDATSLGGVYPAANVAAIATMMALIYPVGSVYTNASDSTNPGTLLGIGTWVAIEGECVVGYKAADGDFGSAGTVAAGEKTHTLLEAELAAHTHSRSVSSANNNSGAGESNAVVECQSANINSTVTGTSGSTGSGTAHNNIQPSYVCYVWRRTA